MEPQRTDGAAGYTPMAIRAALVSVIGEIAGHTAPVI